MMSDNKLMGKYIKYLSKRYIIEEEYLKDLFIQLKTFIIYWFDKKMNANIQYIEYNNKYIWGGVYYFNNLLTKFKLFKMVLSISTY